MPKTFADLVAMCRSDATSNAASALQDNAKSHWRYYGGKQFSDAANKRFAELGIIPFSLNQVAPSVDGYAAGVDLDSLEPTVRALDQRSASIEELGTAMLRWGRNSMRFSRVEKEILRTVFIQGVAACHLEVTSNRGRTCWRVNRIAADQLRWDPRATEANFSDTQWRARVVRKTPRELKTDYPEWWAAIRNRWKTDVPPGASSLFDGGESVPSSSSIEVAVVEWRERIVRARVLANPEAMELQAVVAEQLSLHLDDRGWVVDDLDEYVDALEAAGGDYTPEGVERVEFEQYYYAIVVGGEIVQQGPLPENCFRIVVLTGPTLLNWTGDLGYRSIVGDIYAAQDLLNTSLTLMIDTIAGAGKGGLLVPPTGRLSEIQENWAKPRSVTQLDFDPQQVREITSDTGALAPANRLLELAQRAIDTNLGTNSYARGGAGSTGDLRRVSGGALEQVLARADASVKAYIQNFADWRTEVAAVMLAQLVYWPLSEMGTIVDPSLVAPLIEQYPGDELPLGFTVGVQIEMREPGDKADQEVAGQVLSQGLLQQFEALGIMPPPHILLKIVQPVIPTLTANERREWMEHIAYQQQVMQQQAAQQQQEQPTQEVAGG